MLEGNPILKRLVRVLASSVGKKFVMGITGLLLCGFLVAHLVGNLFLFAGAEAYNDYAHSLHEQEWLVKIVEVGLVVLFAAHIFLAVRTTIDNRAARRHKYAEKRTKIAERLFAPAEWAPETWMFLSGAIVLGFLILHLVDFTFEIRPGIDYEGEEPFDKAVQILTNPLSAVVYVAGCLVLGLHLGHGVMSAFRSLGLSQATYNPWIHCAGIVFAFVIAGGFILFVPWAWLR